MKKQFYQNRLCFLLSFLLILLSNLTFGQHPLSYYKDLLGNGYHFRGDSIAIRYDNFFTLYGSDLGLSPTDQMIVTNSQQDTIIRDSV